MSARNPHHRPRQCRIGGAGRPARQRGVAIITVMLMVVMISVGLYALVGEQGIAVRRAGAQHTLTTAASLAVAGERFAAALLLRDRESGERGDSDSPEDVWANSLPPVPIEHAVLSGCVIDLQGRFNLNNLVDAEGRTDALQVQRFEGLLTALELDTGIAAAVVDWIDPDQVPQGADGAEDDYYLGLNPPYRAANQPFTSTSELRLLLGLSGGEDADEALATLLPHVSALPPGTPINVNSATPAVLEGIAEHINATQAEELARDEDNRWEHYPGCPPASLEDLITAQAGDAGDRAAYENLESFLEITKNEDDQVDQSLLDVKSSHFLLRIEVTIGDIQLVQYSQLQRAKNGASVVRRRSRSVL